MPKIYRNGAVGALMDEYERAGEELTKLISAVPQDQYLHIVDPDTEDPDCRSIQTIMNHVVRSGYGYANYIRKQFGDDWTERKEDYGLSSPEIACRNLDEMLVYSVHTLANKWELSYEEMVANSMRTSWGQDYDFEQLFEHAILHIMRHRRQIERFLIKMEN